MMKTMKIRDHIPGRREFISKISLAAAMGIIRIPGIEGASVENKNPEIPQSGIVMPTIKLGAHTISRLICGSNPMLGYSYMGPHTDRQMKEYFTTERIVELLQKCEQTGISAHQSSSRFDYMNMLRESGSKIKIITLLSDREGISPAIEKASPVALVHHGGVTDRLFAEGKPELVHDFVKAVKDNGLLAGVSAHNPDVIKQIADKGWEVDFFMTCFYYLTRKMEKPEAVPILPVGSYNFYKDDPKVMTQVIRQVKQPCLAFKILGAGRLTSSQKEVTEAFKFAFDNIKSNDGVIVGMFPWLFDEIGANAQYTREFGKASG
jgi:hypothetical protein